MRTITNQNLVIIQEEVELIELSNNLQYYEVIFKDIQKESWRIRSTVGISFEQSNNVSLIRFS